MGEDKIQSSDQTKQRQYG